MGPNIKSVDKSNAATPVSGDILKILQGQLDEGAFGTGVGPLQRQAGTGIQQYVKSLQTRAGQGVNTESKVMDNTSKLIEAVTNRSRMNENKSAGDLREAFGAAGTRYGTSLARGEGTLRAESGANLDQMIASILTDQGARQQSAREFDVNANEAAGVNHNNQLMSALNAMFGQGEANTNPFFSFADKGILDPEVIASPSTGSQLLGAFSSIFGNYLAGGGKIPNPFGGDGNGNTPNGTPFKLKQFGNMPKIGGGQVGEPTVINPPSSSGTQLADLLNRHGNQFPGMRY